MANVNDIVNTREFATLPAVATKILSLLENEDVNMHDLLKIVETDPSLTLKLLKIANSPLYGTRREITSIQQAIMMIGFSKLTNIVLGISIFSKFWLSTQKEAAVIMNKFWNHSASTGIVAKSITQKLKINFSESEFIGGLLYQMGKLAMIQYKLKDYLQVIDEVSENGKSDIEAEISVFGLTHLEVSKEIAKSWKLPDDLAALISYYNNPDKLGDHKDLGAIVNLAGIICEMHGADFYKGLNYESIEESKVWQYLSERFPELSSNGIDFVISDIEELLEQSKDLLNVMK